MCSRKADIALPSAFVLLTTLRQEEVLQDISFEIVDVYTSERR